jgi:addiction module RelB/DinJ family antitoxin
MAVSEKVRTSLTLDRELKEKAKVIIKKYGLSLSDAVNLFLYEIVSKGKLEIDHHILPTQETWKAIQASRKKHGRYVTLEEFRREILGLEETNSSEKL